MVLLQHEHILKKASELTIDSLAKSVSFRDYARLMTLNGMGFNPYTVSHAEAEKDYHHAQHMLGSFGRRTAKEFSQKHKSLRFEQVFLDYIHLPGAYMDIYDSSVFRKLLPYLQQSQMLSPNAAIIVPNKKSLRLSQYGDIYSITPIKARGNALYAATVKLLSGNSIFGFDHKSTLVPLDASYPFVKLQFKKGSKPLTLVSSSTIDDDDDEWTDMPRQTNKVLETFSLFFVIFYSSIR